MTKVGIVNIGIGNIGSLVSAIYNLGWDYKKVSSPNDLNGLTHLILPGVGAFDSAIKKLKSSMLIDPIINFANSKKPLLGICLGMQLLANIGHENTVTEGLGLIEGEVVKLKNKKLPHIGWNSIIKKNYSPIIKNIPDDIDFYFVHSFCFQAYNKEDILALTEYEQKFVSAIQKNNVLGVQFHPEKSQKNGIKIINNFCQWDGIC